MAMIDRLYGRDPQTVVDFNLAVSSGLLSEAYAPVAKFGYNNDIDAGIEETIQAQGGEWQPPTAAYTLDITSTSTDDTLLGSGSWYVFLFGLDANYNEITEQVTLDGTNTVTTTQSYIALNRAAVAYSGTGQDNAGDITFTQSTGGLQLGLIPTGEAITQQCVYTVPAGYQGNLLGVYTNAVKPTGGSNPTVEVELYSYNILSNTKYNVLSKFIDTNNNNSEALITPVSNITAEKNTLYLNATSDTNNTRIYGRFYMILQKLRG